MLTSRLALSAASSTRASYTFSMLGSPLWRARAASTTLPESTSGCETWMPTPPRLIRSSASSIRFARASRASRSAFSSAFSTSVAPGE